MTDFSVPSKKRKNASQNWNKSPLPVPIANITKGNASSNNWLYYTGYLENGNVLIYNKGDMDYLYRMGFFGKGRFSRGEPMLSVMGKFGYTQKTKKKLPNVMSKRRYLRHRYWANQDPDLENPEEVAQRELNSRTLPEIETQTSTSHNQFISQNIPNIFDKNSKTLPTSSCDIGDDNSSAESDTEMEADHMTFSEAPDWSKQEADEDFWLAEVDLKPEVKNDDEKIFKLSDFDYSTDESNVLSKNRTIEKSNNYLKNLCDRKSPDKNEIINSEPSLSCDNFQSENQQNIKLHPSNVEGDESTHKSDILKGDNDEIVSETLVLSEKSDNTPKEKTLHPLSCEDDLEGDILVVGDSEGEEDENEVWRVCLKKDPFPIKEPLVLTLEEAFFLSYGLGCLTVVNENQKHLNLEEMWTTFVDIRQNFIPNYIAYHNLRSKGWVPKCGLKYGAEFVLYKRGPPFYHSSFSVMVRPAIESTLKRDPLFPARYSTWASLLGVDRITEHVAKEILICYVIRSRDVSAEDLRSPCCIKQFKVQEIIMKRFNPNQERTQKDEQK